MDVATDLSRLIADTRTPVTLITGFLGSGKTTLLNYLLRQPQLKNAAVVINEFGEIGLDHDLVSVSTENMVLLQNGCLCCTIRGDLIDTLHDLLERRVLGEVAGFERLIIETTGLADPTPILQTLLTDQVLVDQFRLDGVVVTVDAATADATLDTQFEAVKQVAAADRLLLTKSDLVLPAAVRALEQRLARLNPSAPITRAHNGMVDAALLSEIGRSEFADYGDEPAVATTPHDPRIRSYSLRLAQPIATGVFDTWVDTLVSLKGPELLRLKGFVAVRDMPGPMLIHGVQHVFHPPVLLEHWPSGDHSTRLIIIGRDLDPAVVERSLDFLRRTAD